MKNFLSGNKYCKILVFVFRILNECSGLWVLSPHNSFSQEKVDEYSLPVAVFLSKNWFYQTS